MHVFTTSVLPSVISQNAMEGETNCEFYIYYYLFRGIFSIIYIGEGKFGRSISHRRDALTNFLSEVNPDNIYVIRYTGLTKQFGKYCEAMFLTTFRLNKYSFTSINCNFVCGSDMLINKVTRNGITDNEILWDIKESLVSQILTLNESILHASN